MTHPGSNTTQQPPPLTLYYLGKPVRLLHHHGHCCLLADDILALLGPRLHRFLQQKMADSPPCHIQLPHQDAPLCGWPEPALQRALRQSQRPAARRLRDWLARQVVPALHQLQAILEQGPGWQHSHWLLTLDYTPDHPRRHAHGRLVALDSQVTPLRALAQYIAGPCGLASNNGDLLKLAAACHQQLASRMEKQAWRTQAAEATKQDDRHPVA